MGDFQKKYWAKSGDFSDFGAGYFGPPESLPLPPDRNSGYTPTPTPPPPSATT